MAAGEPQAEIAVLVQLRAQPVNTEKSIGRPDVDEQLILIKQIFWITKICGMAICLLGKTLKMREFSNTWRTC